MTAEMKAQLMKVTGITDVAEFDKMVKEHVPHIENFDQTFEKHSPFDLQLVMFKEQIESQGTKEFRRLADVEEKVEHVYKILIKDPDFRDISKLCTPLLKGEKDAEKSKRSRDLGNKNFQKKVHEEAIRYYTEAVLLGPIEAGKGKEAALGLGNRSVVLFTLKDYEACLEDIAGALELGYPEDMHYKVYERRGHCQKALGRFEEARSSFQAAVDAMAAAKLKEEKRGEVVKELEAALASLKEAEVVNPVALMTSTDRLRIWSPHKQFPCMSDAVSIRYNEDAGRHGIAEQKINPGEVVLIEEPLSWTVNVKSFPTACQGCVRTVGRTPFPSPNHPNAVFCCHSCFAKYRERLGTLDNLSLLEMFGSNNPESTNSALLAFRAIIQQPSKFFVENRSKLFEVHDKEYGTKESEEWRFEGTETLYRGLFNLVNHMEELTPSKEMDTVIKSAVLLRFLISGGYFGPNSSSSGSLTKEQAFLGRLLTIFQCGINYNQHGVYQAEGVIEAGKKLPIVDVGSAFYPNMVLFNHSCCPNTLRINRGRVSYMVAKHTIMPGEEVTDCYGLHHLSTLKEERVPAIQKGFFFTCKCQACEENWPPLHQLEGKLSPADMAKLGTLLSKYQSNFREHNLCEAQSCCVQYLEKLQEMGVRPPHRNYEVASMALSSCFWAELQ